MKLNRKQTEDLRGVFFIVKGQYKKGVEPSFINEATGLTNHIGGYDPSDENTVEWYMVLDRITFNCVCCGSDFEKVKRGVFSAIKKYKTKDKYLKVLRERDQRSNVSNPTRCLYQAIYNTYGDFYSEIVEDLEDQAYSGVVFKTPLERSKDIKKKTGVKKLVSQSNKEVKNEEIPKTIKKRTPLRKSLKKLLI